MEDGTVGKHCEHEGCNQKEYYAFHCADCNKYFCGEHRHVICSETQMNPEPAAAASQNQQEEVKTECAFQSDACEGEAISLCTLCNKYFCLAHRFEDQHNCVYLQNREQEEQKVRATH